MNVNQACICIATLKFVLVITFAIIASIGFAQNTIANGFIINHEKDTIYHTLVEQTKDQPYSFCLLNEGESVRRFKPDEILGYGFVGGNVYLSGIEPGYFVRLLVLGDLSLYMGKDKYYVKKGHSIFSLDEVSESDKISGKDSQSWRDILAWLIKDGFNHPGARVSRVVLEDQRLTQLVAQYNRNVGAPHQLFNEIKRIDDVKRINIIKRFAGAFNGSHNDQFSVGVVFGLVNSRITAKNNQLTYLEESYSSIDPYGGMRFSFRFNPMAEGASIEGAITYSQADFSSIYEVSDRFVTDYYTTEIKLAVLSLPIALKNTFYRDDANDLYVLFGFNYDKHFRSETSLSRERLSGTNWYEYETETYMDLATRQFGATLGAGYNRSFKHIKAGFGLQYFHMSNLNAQKRLINTYTSRIALSINVSMN